MGMGSFGTRERSLCFNEWPLTLDMHTRFPSPYHLLSFAYLFCCFLPPSFFVANHARSIFFSTITNVLLQSMTNNRINQSNLPRSIAYWDAPVTRVTWLKCVSNSWMPKVVLVPDVPLYVMSRDPCGKEIFCVCSSGNARQGVCVKHLFISVRECW